MDKMKLHKTKEKEIYYYYLKNGEKRYMYRHLYYDLLGKRRERKRSGFKSLKEAQRELLKLKAAMLDNNHLQVDKNEMSLSQWIDIRSEEHTSELQSRGHLVCRLLLEKKKNKLLIGRQEDRQDVNV